MHWISAWVLVILLATAYEAIAGKGRLVDHPEAIGRIAFGVTVGVISYVVQKIAPLKAACAAIHAP